MFLFGEGAIEDLGVVLVPEDFGPGAEGAVDGDLVMLDLVAGGDEDDVANAVVGGIADLGLG